MSEPVDKVEPGAWSDPAWSWPVVQPPIYIMGAGTDTMSRAGERVAKVARQGFGPVATVAMGAVITALAFYAVPRVLDGLRQSETVDLDVEE